MINLIIEKLKSSEKILIVSHKNPDGDTLGANFALALSLTESGKYVVSYCDSKIPSEYEFLLKNNVKFTRELGDSEVFDIVIFVDCGDSNRSSRFKKIKGLTECIINIDHHKTNTNFGHINLVKANSSSTGEIIFEILTKGKFPINKNIAECLYTAILTDTGSFRYSNTNENTFQTASKLLEFGVNSWEIAEKVYESRPLKRILIMKEALNSLDISKNGKVATMTVTYQILKKYKGNSEDTDGLVNIGRSIAGIEFSIFIREEENGCKISFRSKGNLDVAKFAKEIGGGGHKNAAGAFLKEPLDNVKSRIAELIEKHGL